MSENGSPVARRGHDTSNPAPEQDHPQFHLHHRAQRSGHDAAPLQGRQDPAGPQKPLRIVTPEDFDTFLGHLPDPTSRLLVETAIESGMRWGELAELRPSDLDLRARIVTITRAVVELNAKYHPDGQRFLIKEYPKD